MSRVYIGRLSYSVREKDIQRFFSGYGRLLDVDLKYGYGFVEFEDSRSADDAVYELDGKKLCGERVIVEHARRPRWDRAGYSYGSRSGGSGYSSRRSSGRDKYGPPVRTEYRLIVKNLSSRCSWQDLKDFMKQAGEVTYADAHKERTNEGVIEFRSYSDMKRALDKLDGTEINGRNIRLIEDKPRTSHRRSYSGSGSSSQSRRRSRSRSRRSSCSRSRSRSRSRSKGRSRSRSKGWKSGSKSKSKPRSDWGSHSRSQSPKENGKGVIKSKSRSRTSRQHSVLDWALRMQMPDLFIWHKQGPVPRAQQLMGITEGLSGDTRHTPPEGCPPATRSDPGRLGPQLPSSPWLHSESHSPPAVSIDAGGQASVLSLVRAVLLLALDIHLLYLILGPCCRLERLEHAPG
ncbi:PREDICTED: serine/arginine-rich splicing factor 6-like [Elephantulus edwardii]|uniref:serine/arginine-rich splicing factor 6-like n=1 Tax=Elephantulus edwardii TaxID=28737 RepID=UPI0003F0BFCB|nr:PREDICTED: serine/arginine-rich splicing factor 6-like [Elephantulus edwardii]